VENPHGFSEGACIAKIKIKPLLGLFVIILYDHQFSLFALLMNRIRSLSVSKYIMTIQIIGPSGVCALHFAAGRNEGGHYFR
jgi:hypothetical protein